MNRKKERQTYSEENFLIRIFTEFGFVDYFYPLLFFACLFQVFLGQFDAFAYSCDSKVDYFIFLFLFLYRNANSHSSLVLQIVAKSSHISGTVKINFIFKTSAITVYFPQHNGYSPIKKHTHTQNTLKRTKDPFSENVSQQFSHTRMKVEIAYR